MSSLKSIAYLCDLYNIFLLGRLYETNFSYFTLISSYLFCIIIFMNYLIIKNKILQQSIYFIYTLITIVTISYGFIN